MQGDLELRKKLGKLVSEESSENWWKPDLFEQNTKKELPPELKILESPPPSYKNYNCFVHALGLYEDPLFLGEENWEFTRNLGDVFKELISSETFKKLPEVQEGCLIVYRTDAGVISHVGIMCNKEIVISKWSWGPLLQHKIFDVPDHYGNTIEYYTGTGEARDLVLGLRRLD